MPHNAASCTCTLDELNQANPLILTLQCASAVYHTSGTSWGSGGLCGASIVTEDSGLSDADELDSATLEGRTVILSRGATLAL